MRRDVRLKLTQRGMVGSVVVMIVVCATSLAYLLSAIAPYTPPAAVRAAASQPLKPLGALLPGEQLWSQGVSSLLFGTNDTYEWSPHNLETEAPIQQALRTAGFTLIRTFIPDKASDTAIESRIQAIEHVGAQCLAVLTNIDDVTFDEHVVRYLGARCLLYECGNEPSVQNISFAHYMRQWNSMVPLLRKANPAAKFIGPASYEVEGSPFTRAFLEGVKQSGVWPDAVSAHWYPCFHLSEEECVPRASNIATLAGQLHTLIKSILGTDLPLGITEWNFSPESPAPAYVNDANFLRAFTRTALQAMAAARVAFACQFDAASYAAYGGLDLFDVSNDQPKPQFEAMRDLIASYHPIARATPSPSVGNGPLISRGKPAVCSSNALGGGSAASLVAAHYGNYPAWRTDLARLPSWCAVHVGVGTSQVLFLWSSDYYRYIYVNDASLAPRDYTISVSADSTNGSDGTWHVVASVTGNHTYTREQLVPFAGQAWLKMTVTAGQPHATQPLLQIDQLDIYDASTAVSLNDTFFFSGDSITAAAYDRGDNHQPSFADLVHTAQPLCFPAPIDGGLGGWTLHDALGQLDSWLALNPDLHYWLVEWGTNDAFGMVAPATYRADLQAFVSKVLAAGHVPILAHLPYIRASGGPGSPLDQEVRALNQVIDAVTDANQLIPGPDLNALTASHTDTFYVSDGIHPSAAGAIAMNRAWFDAFWSSHGC
jgi:lysophospholipase L1-like esterase